MYKKIKKASVDKICTRVCENVSVDASNQYG